MTMAGTDPGRPRVRTRSHIHHRGLLSRTARTRASRRVSPESRLGHDDFLDRSVRLERTDHCDTRTVATDARRDLHALGFRGTPVQHDTPHHRSSTGEKHGTPAVTHEVAPRVAAVEHVGRVVVGVSDEAEDANACHRCYTHTAEDVRLAALGRAAIDDLEVLRRRGRWWRRELD